MADTQDELTKRRWLRQHFTALGKKHPALKTTKHQKRLSAYLTQQALEEQATCPDNPPDDHAGDQQAPDTSTRPGA